MNTLNFKTFEWIKIPFKDIQTEEGETRYYLVDGHKLPSMTSILSVIEDTGIEEWIERVGKEEADKIVDEAIRRGNNLHYLSEEYLKNNLERKDIKGPGALLFNRSKRHLDKLGPIVGVEVALYSIKHRYAGRADCLAFLDKQFCVVDHKNSRRKIDFTKDYARKKIFKYCIQMTGYARAFGEMFPTLTKPTKGVLIVGNVKEMSSNMLVFDLQPFEKELDIILDAYYKRGSVALSAYYKMSDKT